MIAYDTTSIDFNPLFDLTNTDGGMNGTGGGFGGGGGGGTYIPPTPPGNDIRLTFTNLSQYKNQMTFNVQGQIYQETNSAVIDSNTINDILIIKPIVNDEYTLKNYFELRKKLITKKIITNDWVVDYNNFGMDPASSLYGYGNSGLGNLPIGRWVEKIETTQISGIVLNNYNSNNELQGTQEYELPINIDLGFDIVNNIVIKTPAIKIQSVFLVTNYNNSKLNDELQVIINSKDLSVPKTLKIGESIDISNTNNSSEDLSISINGLSSFQLNNIRWQYANKFDSNSIFDVNDFKILSSDNIATLFSNEFNANIILLIEVEPDTSKYASLTLDQSIIDISIAESIFDSPTASKLIDISYTLVATDLVKIITPYREFTQSPAVRETLSLDLKRDFLNNAGSFKILFTPYSTLYGDGITQTLIVNISKYWIFLL